MGVTRADLIEDLGLGVTEMAPSMGGQVGGPVADNVQVLADEVAAWMGVGQVVVSGTRSVAPPMQRMVASPTPSPPMVPRAPARSPRSPQPNY